MGENVAVEAVGIAEGEGGAVAGGVGFGDRGIRGDDHRVGGEGEVGEEGADHEGQAVEAASLNERTQTRQKRTLEEG